MASVELELPSVYLDNLVEDNAPAVIGLTPTLINFTPEPNEVRVSKSTAIQVDIATVGATGTVDAAFTQIFIDGVLAFSAGSAQLGFTGSDSNPQADVLRVLVQPAVPFTSEQVVAVRVLSRATGDASVLDTTYNFTVEDFAPPQVLSAVAQDLQTIRVQFDDDVMETTDGAGTSALTAANYVLQRLGDYMTPLVSAKVVSVAPVTTASVDLTTDIPLTPGGTYRVIANGLEDTDGNVIVAPNNVAQLVGWTPPQPAGRSLDLYSKLPLINRNEDDTGDLFRFIACLQELVVLLLYDIDRFVDILDPDTAPEQWLDLMLEDLGNPFQFELSLVDKRRLAQILVDIYQLKGTRIGIINVIRFFLGLEVTVDEFNSSTITWVLGDSELGDTTILGSDVEHDIYSFTVESPTALTDLQRQQLTDIVDYMKPAHTHFVRLDEPVIPDTPDHWELGLSELGENTFLH